MTTHSLHKEKESFYFITITCYKWLPLFEKSDIYDFFPDWFEKLKKKGILLCGYVIMPNHMHFLAFVGEECEGLNLVIGEGKRFLAYEIVKRLKNRFDDNSNLLQRLRDSVPENEKNAGKKHQVFRLSFDAKLIEGDDKLVNVLDYIHHNPVSGKWQLVKDFTDYPHSSAKFYELGVKDNYGAVDFREIPI